MQPFFCCFIKDIRKCSNGNLVAELGVSSTGGAAQLKHWKNGGCFWYAAPGEASEHGTTTKVVADFAGICSTSPVLQNNVTRIWCLEVFFLPHFSVPASKSTTFFFSRFRRRYQNPANPTAQGVNTSKATETPRAIALNE